MRGQLGETQRRPLGFPYFRTPLGRRRIGPLASLAVVLIGTTLAATATLTALLGSPSMGVVSENPGGVVLNVESGSYAWQLGIRAGQTVVRLESSDSPGGGAITTAGPDSEIRASTYASEGALRATLPVALVAAGLAVLAILSAAWHARRAEALASLAVVLAAVPLGVASGPALAVTARLAALALPALWLLRRTSPGRWRTAGGGAALAMGGAWMTAWAAVPSLFDQLETARTGVVILAGGAIIGLQLDRQAIAERLRSAGGLRTLDVAMLALAIILGVGLQLVAGAPPIVTLGILAVGLLVYPRWRRVAGAAIDRLLVADLRDRLTLAASEAERSRLARDLHDVPLQELAGVIRRLDLVPDARGENAALRDVADQLRTIATELRPPILDDLGLPAAIASLVAHSDREAEGFQVEAAVQDDIGSVPTDRPPAAVEIALYRIVQEALANAISHSGGHRAVVEGVVGADRITLTIRDDGTGLPRGALNRATREGRLGVHSMRRRAESIGATLTLRASPEGGLAVTVSWTR